MRAFLHVDDQMYLHQSEGKCHRSEGKKKQKKKKVIGVTKGIAMVANQKLR
jgi:hypothetical protein